MDQCDDDPKCEGVECGSIYCSLLESGRCSKTELIHNPKGSKETCFKVIAFECKTTEVIEFKLAHLFILDYQILYILYIFLNTS